MQTEKQIQLKIEKNIVRNGEINESIPKRTDEPLYNLLFEQKMIEYQQEELNWSLENYEMEVVDKRRQEYKKIYLEAEKNMDKYEEDYKKIELPIDEIHLNDCDCVSCICVDKHVECAEVYFENDMRYKILSQILSGQDDIWKVL